MPVAATSLEAYDSVELGARQAEVLETLRALGEASDQDLADTLGLAINSITPRRGELEALGLVVRAGFKVGRTGRRVSVWRPWPRQLNLFGGPARAAEPAKHGRREW